MVQPRAIESADAFQALLAQAVASRRGSSPTERQHVVASIPWSLSLLGLYAFSALTLPESAPVNPDAPPPLTLAICADAAMLRLNMDILRHSGFTAPEVALLDTAQMPHEEREVLNWLDRGRVRLLLMTPESFTSLRLLATLARLNLTLVVIEDAQQLMPHAWGHAPYQRLAATLKRFVELPTIALLSGPLGTDSMVALAQTLDLPQATLCRFPTPLNQLACRVHFPLTAHQQLAEMLQLLARPDVGAVRIRVRNNKQAFKLAAMLDDAKSDRPVWQYPFANGGTEAERDPRVLRQQLQDTPKAIVIDSSPPGRLLPLANQANRHTVIYWDLPPQLDLLVMDGVRAFQAAEGDEQLPMPTQLHVFYNRELYADAKERLTKGLYSSETRRNPRVLNDGQQALLDVRQWCLSEECRLIGLARRLGYPLPGPCGVCDTCQDHPTPARGFFRKVVRQALYS